MFSREFEIALAQLETEAATKRVAEWIDAVEARIEMELNVDDLVYAPPEMGMTEEEIEEALARHERAANAGNRLAWGIVLGTLFGGIALSIAFALAPISNPTPTPTPTPAPAPAPAPVPSPAPVERRVDAIHVEGGVIYVTYEGAWVTYEYMSVEGIIEASESWYLPDEIREIPSPEEWYENLN